MQGAQKPTVMEVLAFGDAETLNRPCVDCGLVTGCFCDLCYAVDRDPDSHWMPDQHTPLCTACDHKYRRCHFCRGMAWAVPAPTKLCAGSGVEMDAEPPRSAIKKE